MPVSSLIFVQLLIEKLGARRSYDFPPNEKNDVTNIQSSSDAKNATVGFMKNAREKFVFVRLKERQWLDDRVISRLRKAM